MHFYRCTYAAVERIAASNTYKSIMPYFRRDVVNAYPELHGKMRDYRVRVVSTHFYSVPNPLDLTLTLLLINPSLQGRNVHRRFALQKIMVGNGGMGIFFELESNFIAVVLPFGHLSKSSFIFLTPFL
jgi:hypothetical protein